MTLGKKAVLALLIQPLFIILAAILHSAMLSFARVYVSFLMRSGLFVPPFSQ